MFASSDKKVRVFDIEKQDAGILHQVEMQYPLQCVKPVANGASILTCGHSGTVNLIDLGQTGHRGGQNFQSPNFRDGEVITSLATIDSNTFVSGSNMGVVNTWDIRMPTNMLKSVKLSCDQDGTLHDDPINQVMVVKGSIFAACSTGIRLFRTSNLAEIENRSTTNSSNILTMCYSELDNKLFAAGFDQKINVYNIT